MGDVITEYVAPRPLSQPPLLTLPPGLVSSPSPEVFKPGLDVCLRGMPGLEICIHVLVGEGRLAPTQSRCREPTMGSYTLTKEALRHLVDMSSNCSPFPGRSPQPEGPQDRRRSQFHRGLL